MGRDEVIDPFEREAYAVANLDRIGEGYGFRKISHQLGVGGPPGA